MLEMGLAKFYPFTECEVSSFTCSTFTEGVKNLKILPLTLTTPLLGKFCCP